MVVLPKFNRPMPEADYLTFERDSEMKHEFIDGDIYAMSGASEAHNLITSNLIAMLHGQLRGRPCKIYPSDMKVSTPASRSYVYPDVIVVCGEARFDDDQRAILLNPTVMIEVLSPNTEGYDRGLKFQRYREIESLKEYVLVAQGGPHIERFMRQSSGMWQFNEAHGLDAVLDLIAVECQLTLVEVYERINFEIGDVPDEDE